MVELGLNLYFVRILSSGEPPGIGEHVCERVTRHCTIEMKKIEGTIEERTGEK